MHSMTFLFLLIYIIIPIGEFGIVYKGYIIKEQGSLVTDTVAIKTLKGDSLIIQL